MHDYYRQFFHIFLYLCSASIFTSVETHVHFLALELAEEVEECLRDVMEGQNSSQKHNNMECLFTVKSYKANSDSSGK